MNMAKRVGTYIVYARALINSSLQVMNVINPSFGGLSKEGFDTPSSLHSS